MTDAPASRPRFRAAPRLVILVASIGAGCSAIALASQYQRPEPLPAQPHPGMTVGSDAVTLGSDASQWSALTVEPATAAAPHWSDPVPARVVFDETRTSRLGSPLGGRVTRLFVERGQRVALGDSLFTVASSGLAELRSERDKAVVERASARVNLERTQALVDGQALPGKELVAANQQLAESELAVRLADQKLSSLRVTSAGDSSFTVTAPRAGVVVELNLAAGQQVDATTGAGVAIADLSDVWVVADVFEADLGALTEGAKAKLVTADLELEGTVDRISAIVDPDRHTIPIRVKLPNPTGALRPNAHAQLRFLDASIAKAELPASAVISDGTSSYVYARERGALRRRPVVVGSVRGGRAALLSGVSPGEQIVTHGATLLDNQIQLEN
jgi:cobalt-zinc-cadmium efflux system membrane fusion protein